MKLTIAVCAAVVAILIAVAAVIVQSADSRVSQLQANIQNANSRVSQLQAKLDAPRTAVIPAIVGHYGLCVGMTQDPTTGDLSYVTITAPKDTAGVVSCSYGSFVSVAPGQ